MDDPRRPAVHLTADDGWINDPLSPTWDGERYHLFFQHVPGSVQWLPSCHWGHAVSPDLLTWSQTADALAPGDGDGGVWSGSVVARPGGGHRAFYTAVDASGPAVGWVRVADAHSLDGPWAKGPVVVRAPEGLEITSFRDPFVEQVGGPGGGWRMLLAASLADTTAAVLSWSSTDLDHWSFDGVALARSTSETEPMWTGSLWECPQLVSVDGVDVLVGSVWHDDVLHHVAATTVRRAGTALEAVGWQQLTAGEGYYAPVVFRDAGGEPCIMFWIRGFADVAAGRAGVLSVPHRLVLREGRVGLALHPAVASRADLVHGPLDLRTGPCRVGALQLSHVDGAVLVELAGAATRLDAPPDGIVVVVDGPVVEVVTRGTSFAGILPSADGTHGQ